MKERYCLLHGVTVLAGSGMEGAGDFSRKGELHGMMRNELYLVMDFAWD